MSDFKLLFEQNESLTYISNIFIDHYMPAASGSYVKVYLYLLRHCSDSEHILSLDHMADVLENTSADILRALRYWNKNGVLSVSFDASGAVTSVSILPLSKETSPVQTKATPPEPVPTAATKETIASITTPSFQLPERHNYTPMEAQVLQNDSEIRNVLTITETMLGEPLSGAHLQLILYLMSDLGFSSELIIYLYETSLSKDKKAPRYLEAVALNWAKKGISSITEAEEETAMFNIKYTIVTKTLGITRQLAPPERAIIDGWEKYHFSETIITEACKRTILQTGKPNLNYTGKILADWNQKGIRSLADIDTLDKTYHQSRATVAKTAQKKNQFQNFTQRTYTKDDYVSLEQQLLQKQQ